VKNEPKRRGNGGKMKDGFGREVGRRHYYCASCGNITYHNKQGHCENTDSFKREMKRNEI